VREGDVETTLDGAASEPVPVERALDDDVWRAAEAAKQRADRRQVVADAALDAHCARRINDTDVRAFRAKIDSAIQVHRELRG
jgi:hypothetical protein